MQDAQAHDRALALLLATGDLVNLLNIGGCLGICTSSNPDIGPPFDCEVLGQVLHFPYLGERIGVPANIRQGARALTDRLAVGGVPVIAVVGTCMNSGKTFACTSLIQELQAVFSHPYDEQPAELEAKVDRLRPREFFNAGGVSHYSCSS